MGDPPTTLRARPPVAVVMPFAGTPSEAAAALAALDALRLRDGDAVVLADNSGTTPSADPRVVRAPGERSPSHARNVGASAVTGTEWLLFLDADCRPAPDLLDAFLAEPVAAEVGALAGEVRPDPSERTGSLAARYGATRNFLDSGSHLAHPFRPRLAAANLLVRRAAFDAVGGFQEGIRTAEDTDLCWRLQEAGWRLALRPDARVTHAYRPTLRDLRTQWRGYAAGRAWLARRYPGFTPQPALLRAAARFTRPAPAAGGDPPTSRRSIDHADRALVAVDVLLGLEELRGLALANRPRDPPAANLATTVQTVLIAEPHPPAAPPEPGTRVEAARRPPGPRATPATAAIAYREDDGAWQRLAATVRLAVTRPRATLADGRRRHGGPPLPELAPVVARLGDAEIQPLDDPAAHRLAARLQALR